MGQGAPEVTSLCTYSTEPVTYTTFNKQNTQLYFIRNGLSLKLQLNRNICQ